MKKLLILLSLTTAITTLGAPSGNSVNKGDMEITATVIKPLTVIATSMEFGQVIQGSKTTASSNYQITGEKGQPITIEIPNTVELASISGDTMVATIEYRNLPNSIGESGSTNFNVYGDLKVASEQAVGNYTGTLTARVQYQ